MKRRRAEDLQGAANLSAPSSMVRRKLGYLFTITSHALPPNTLRSSSYTPLQHHSTMAKHPITLIRRRADNPRQAHCTVCSVSSKGTGCVWFVLNVCRSLPVHMLSNISFLGGCGSFYAITIASESFKGLSTVKQHKLVTEALKQEIEGIHGLQVPPAFYCSSLQDLQILRTD